MNNYDWIVVGGGIGGIVVSEILSRGGKSVLLIEKNDMLGSETTKVFHEWLHSGSLYSLAPDKLQTLRYLLGATDDLFEYYHSYQRMNLKPTESGIRVHGEGWFNNENIEYRYKKHLLNPVWSSLVSRSINIIELLEKHDWLRRRAGSVYGESKVKVSHWFNKIVTLNKGKSDFYCRMSPDLTINSRELLKDLLSSAINGGLSILTGQPVNNIVEKTDFVSVETNQGNYKTDRVVICSPDFISKFLGIPIKIGYAPIAVVKDVPEDEKSFVELDYNTRKCINLLKKNEGIGQAGGITLKRRQDIDSYLKYIISEHQKRNPSIKFVDSYVGLKKELVMKGEDRNYLYHINQNSNRVWSIVLGKFSLAFSMAPEFYRRVYLKNPPKIINKDSKKIKIDNVSETSWKEIILKSRE
jgi:hypothetical protein